MKNNYCKVKKSVKQKNFVTFSSRKQWVRVLWDKLYTSKRPIQTSTHYSWRENVWLSSLPIQDCKKGWVWFDIKEYTPLIKHLIETGNGKHLRLPTNWKSGSPQPYVSVNSKPDHSPGIPPGNFLKGWTPHPQAQKCQTPIPRAEKSC